MSRRLRRSRRRDLPSFSGGDGGEQDLGPTIILDQGLSFGALTLQDAGDVRVSFTGSSPSDVIKTGGTSTADYNISSTGVVTASGDGSPSSGTVTGSYNGGVDTFTLTMTSIADAYSVSGDAQLFSVVALAAATTSGKTFLVRPGPYAEFTVDTKAYTSETTLTTHGTKSDTIFEGIFVKLTDNFTITDLTFEDTVSTGGGPIVLYQGGTDCKLDVCTVRGIQYDLDADYSIVPYPGNSNGVGMTVAAPTNLAITNNLFEHLEEGVVVGAVAGNYEVSGNLIQYFYEDGIKTGRSSSSVGTYTRINDNVFHGNLSKSTDVGNPHTDYIQFLGSALVSDWVGIEILRNIGFAELRGEPQCVLFDDASGGIFFTAEVKGNAFFNQTASQGIIIGQAKDCVVIGNTCAKMDPVANEGLTLTIAVGGLTTSGTHKVWQNITEAISIGGTPNTQNNVIMGRKGVAIPYTDVFDTVSFAPETLAEVKSTFTMKPFGPADTDNSGTPTVYDSGAIGSGYVTFADTNPGQTNASLDLAYEAEAYTQNLVDNQGTASFSSIAIGASDTDKMTFSVWVDLAADSATYGLYLASGRTEIKLTSGKIDVLIKSTANATLYDGLSTTTILAADGLTHVFVVADLGLTPTVDVYINGVAETMVETVAPTTGIIDHTRASYLFLSGFDGILSDYFISLSEALDVSSFISGANPLNIIAVDSPEVFLGNDMTADERDGNPAEGWNDGFNLGSGGLLTVTSATFVDVPAPIPLSDFDSDFDSDHG